MSGAKIADVEVSAAALAGFLGAAGASSLAVSGANKLQAIADRKTAEAARAEHHESAIRAVLTRNVRIEVLRSSVEHARTEYGVTVDVVIPEYFQPGQTTDLLAWCEHADQLLLVAEQRLSSAIAASATAIIDTGTDSGLVTVVSTQQRAKPEREEINETLRRVLSRLAPDTTHAERAPVITAVQQVRRASSVSEAESRLTEVRIRVSNANKLAANRRDQVVAATRGKLEQELVASKVTSALDALGYSVSAGFETLTAKDGEVYVTRDGWSDHAVKMRIDATGVTQQLRVAMVRTTEPTSADDRRRDVERENEWCESFAALRDTLASDGVHTNISWALDHISLPVAPGGAASRSKASSIQRHRERES